MSVTGWCCTLHSSTLCSLHSGPKQHNNTGLMSVTGWCCTFHSSILCSLHSGTKQHNNTGLMSVTGWCCTLHSSTLCSLHSGPKPFPLLEASLELPICYPALCLGLNLHNILVCWSRRHKPVSFSHYDLTNTVSVLLV